MNRRMTFLAFIAFNVTLQTIIKDIQVIFMEGADINSLIGISPYRNMFVDHAVRDK